MRVASTLAVTALGPSEAAQEEHPLSGVGGFAAAAGEAPEALLQALRISHMTTRRAHIHDKTIASFILGHRRL